MATVDKNFRVKHGLVVEGTTATINGNNILTETNSDQYILTLIGGETLVKSVNSADFIVDVNGQLSIATGSDLLRSADLNGYATETYVQNQGYLTTGFSVGSYMKWDGPFLNVDDTIIATQNYVGNQLADYTKTSDLPAQYITSTSGALSVTSQNLDLNLATSGGLTTDNSGPGGATALKVDTDVVVTKTNNQEISNKVITDRLKFHMDGLLAMPNTQATIGTDSSNDLHVESYNTLWLSGNGGPVMLSPLVDGEVYISIADSDHKVATQGYVTGLGYITNSALSGLATESYVGTAIDNLVDGAPGLLNTLNEIAAAINDDANYATTITTALSNKQNTLTSGDGINIASDTVSVNLDSGGGLGFNQGTLKVNLDAGGGLSFNQGTIGVNRNTVDGWYDTNGAAATAESNANDYTDTAIGNIASAVTQIDGNAITPLSVEINSIAKQLATHSTGLTASTVTDVMSLNATDYRTVKAIVKAKNGSHTQVSEILVTLDTSNNVAITEYAMVGTNGSLGDVSAIYNVMASEIRITFTAVNSSTDVMVYATALI